MISPGRIQAERTLELRPSKAAEFFSITCRFLHKRRALNQLYAVRVRSAGIPATGRRRAARSITSIHNDHLDSSN